MIDDAFRFREDVRLHRPTGHSAATLREFRDAVGNAEPAVLGHHLRETPLRFTFTSFEYPNDFALWAADALEDRDLAERLAVLDPFHERDLEALRERVLEAVETVLARGAALPVPNGQEFHFSSSLAVHLDLNMTASTVDELVRHLKSAPAPAIYFHFYSARLRNEDGRDDISRWLEHHGHAGLASSLTHVDIYMLSLEACRRAVVDVISKELR